MGVNKLKKNILEYIDSIDRECISAEVSICESLAERYCKMLLIMENYYDDNVDNFSIFQEGKILDEATGKKKDDNVITKIAMFIPRLIRAIVNAIKHKFSESKRGSKSFGKAIDFDVRVKDNTALNKSLKVVGCTLLAATTAGIVVGIKDYSPAVEFKDDVKFVISESGRLKIIFPYYKIDQINKFNKEIDPKINVLEQYLKSKNRTDKGNVVFSDLSKSFKGIVTNQARISEREFSFEEYEKFILDVKKSFEIFSNKLSEIEKLFSTPEGQIVNKELMEDKKITLIYDLESLVKKTPGDVELITKLDEKIREVFSIITNPNDSRGNKKKYAKFKYEPLSKSEIVDIYKFDTSYLISAIRKMNQFYKELIGSDDHHSLILSEYASKSELFKSAIADLEKQFDVKLNIIYNLDNKNATYSDTFRKSGTSGITLSKSKGFKLGGGEILMELDIRNIILNSMESTNINAPFGQYVCSCICHEIFHNIVGLCNVYVGKVETAINDTINAIYDAPSKLFNNLQGIVDSINNKFKIIFGKNSNDQADKLLKKRLAYLRIKSNDPEAIRLFKKAVKNGTDEKYLKSVNIDGLVENIDTHEKDSSKNKWLNFKKDFNAYQQVVASALFTVLLYHFSAVGGNLVNIVVLMLSIQNVRIAGKKENSNEEQMCDTFAAMYKLPVSFEDMRTGINNGVVRKEYANGNNRHNEHGSPYDRNTVSYNIAKQMLNSGEKLDPEIKEYLTFIVNKNEGINLTERKLTKKQIKKLAPEFTENIRYAVGDFAKKHNIPVTECFVDIEYEIF